MRLSIACPTIPPWGYMWGRQGDFTQFWMEDVPLGWGIWPSIWSNPHVIPCQEQGSGGDLITWPAQMVGYLITCLVKSPPFPHPLPQGGIVGPTIDRCINETAGGAIVSVVNYTKMGSLCSNYAYRLVNLLENRRKMVETALENGIRPVWMI